MRVMNKGRPMGYRGLTSVSLEARYVRENRNQGEQRKEEGEGDRGCEDSAGALKFRAIVREENGGGIPTFFFSFLLYLIS